MQKKRSTKVSNRVIMVVLVLTVAVAVLGTFVSLFSLAPGYSKVTGAASADLNPEITENIECEPDQINQTISPENINPQNK